MPDSPASTHHVPPSAASVRASSGKDAPPAEAVAAPSTGVVWFARETYHSWYLGDLRVYGWVYWAPPSAGTVRVRPVTSAATVRVVPSPRPGKRQRRAKPSWSALSTISMGSPCALRTYTIRSVITLRTREVFPCSKPYRMSTLFGRPVSVTVRREEKSASSSTE
nr:hypothetical protein [Streptomyces hokutonensis]